MPSRPCRLFLQGKCYYGKKCKFSHLVSAFSVEKPARGNRTTGDTRDIKSPATDELHRFRSLLVQKPSSSGRLASGVGIAFFQGARKLMNGDLGAAQETIRLLASEDGLRFIGHLAEYAIPQAGPSLELWQQQVKPLFETVTHERMVDSAVLENQFATIYNYMLGINGRRARAFFDFACDIATSSSPQSQVEVTRLSLAVIYRMIDCDTSNIVSGVFEPIVQAFTVVLKGLDGVPEHDTLQMNHHLDYLNRRLDIGTALPFCETKKKSDVAQPVFHLEQDLPGRHSKQGPRHDNDHVDIAKINILPTYDEIMSTRAEYLPTNDTSLFHKPGIQGRLDREFRLLREDTVGQLRDAVKIKIEAMRKHQANKQHAFQDRSLRTYEYWDASVVSLSVQKRQGLTLLVQFTQPRAAGRELKKRKDWWELSKRLQPGGLVCIVSGRDTAFFAVVSGEPRHRKDKKVQSESKEKKFSLFDDPKEAYISLNLAEETRDSLHQCLQWASESKSKRPSTQWSLVEFPGVLLPSFRYTLEALQTLSKKPDLPFVDILAPPYIATTAGATAINCLTTVSPPLYATKTGFQFDLSSLTEQANTVLHTSVRQPLDPKTLADSSSLDETQSVALLDALSRSMALIQGPPGTGKSFTGEKIIKVLLANKSKANLGPILCVCFTNHALDQLLEHLLDSGVEKIIRIGSRSKSERLEKLNLRVIEKTQDRTREEKSALWASYTEQETYTKNINQSIDELDASEGLATLKMYLEWHQPSHYSELFELEDEDGFIEVDHNKSQRFGRWLYGHTETGRNPRPTEQLKLCRLSTMSSAERHQLHRHWIRQIQEPLKSIVVEDYMRYLRHSEAISNITKDVDLRCLNQADVVGITTTGLARNLSLLRRLRSKVMLCEEAGEVLEAHTITALLPSVEHAILIGDHLQLRPQIQNYELQSSHERGSRYSLDVSLFERLVQPPFDNDPRLPFSTLETQRRMHPSIAELIRSTLYPRLVDGGQVNQYPPVVGFKDRLFWFDHSQREDEEASNGTITTSRTNQFEIEMTTKLVQHLVRQGEYGPEDIAVITPYLGQLHRLRNRMSNIFEVAVGERDLEELEAMETAQQSSEDSTERLPSTAPVMKTTMLKSIRLATVDNFQGEEAKVIVVSLVRSNEERRCGFLKTSNRINVLLSRAKHGLYIIGDSSTYGNVPMWSEVLKILRRDGNIGEAFELQCPRHLDTPIRVSCPDHFLQFAPEGGCNAACDRRLACGHACVTRCHSDVLHQAVKCLEPCPRPRKDCAHACPVACGDICPRRCQIVLSGTTISLPCGHNFSSPKCWQTRDIDSILCPERVQRTIAGCGHTVILPCHINYQSPNYLCPKDCRANLPCGHVCKKLCSACRPKKGGVVSEADHGECLARCGRDYKTCRHSCSVGCHGDLPCPPCQEKCDVRCSHSKCDKKCHEPCAPCAEQECASSCPHTKCSMPCAAPCDWLPCAKRCSSVLECGHQCPSLCGEACPSAKFCQRCGDDDMKGAMVDFIMGTEYQDVDLDVDPCIFADCGHFFTRSSMDGVMDMRKHYELDQEESPIKLAAQTEPFSASEVKVCPTCRGSLRNIARYGRIVRRALLDEFTKKFIVWSNGQSIQLGERLVDALTQLAKMAKPKVSLQLSEGENQSKLVLSKVRVSQMNKMSKLVGNDRYCQLIKLWHSIRNFASKVEKDEQPFHKVANFVRFASKNGAFVNDESLIQIKGSLQATSLSLKCELAVLLDFVNLRIDLKRLREFPVSDLTEQVQDCLVMIATAKERGYPREQLEGHLYYAKFCMIRRSAHTTTNVEEGAGEIDRTADTEKASAITNDAKVHLSQARDLLNVHHSLNLLRPEVEAVELMLTNGTFYTEVTKDEMRAVYAAMAREFRGTGHWYTCVNGHPFTVGECGMPMEEARCPECGQGVGGRSHVPTAGVQRAIDIDDLAREIDHLGM